MSSSTASQLRGRRKAYQCLRCLQKKGRVYVEAKYRVYNHFLKEHLGLDDVPHYCKLCLFRCFKRSDLEQHCASFPRHRMMLKEKDLAGTEDFLVSNQIPYVITERDIVPLSDEASAKHWQGKTSSSDLNVRQEDAFGMPGDLLSAAFNEVFPEGIQEGDLDEDRGSVMSSASVLKPPSVTATHTQPENQVHNQGVTANIDVTMQLKQLIDLMVVQNRQQQAILGQAETPSFTATPCPGEGGRSSAVIHQSATEPEKPYLSPPEEVLPQLAPEPTAEEKRDLCDQPQDTASLPSSSSSSCSSASAMERNRLLRELKVAVEENTQAIRKQEATMKELAGCVLNMSYAMTTQKDSSVRAPEKEKRSNHNNQQRDNDRHQEKERQHSKDRRHNRDRRPSRDDKRIMKRDRRPYDKEDRENRRPKQPRI